MSIKLLAGDCRDVLATLPANSVQCVVTSPPYYGLRDYGTAQWDGGDAACDHTPGVVPVTATDPGIRCSTLEGGKRTTTAQAEARSFRDTCGKCGATRVDRQIGLEATPEEYLATMVQVFREVRRVLRPDGTCWVNIGDSFSGGNSNRDGVGAVPGLAAKQLLMMPARLALALQADGWWVRSMMPWVKRSAMPESVTDRPASAIEYVFLLTKQARYFWDAAAVKVQASGKTNCGIYSDGPKTRANRDGAGGRPSNFDGYRPPSRAFRNSDLFYESLEAPFGLICDDAGDPLALDVNPAAFSQAHFATFSSKLVEPLIRAGTSERGCCSQCGKPWVRVTDKAFVPQPDVSLQRGVKGALGQKPMDASSGWEGVPRGSNGVTTTGWRAGCDHEAPVVPCTVLDPFIGAGTTALVSDRLQRDCIGIDLNVAYTEMAMERCWDDAPLLVDVPAAADPEDGRMADLFAGAAE